MPCLKAAIKGQSYIEVMDWVTQKASQALAQTERITVIVQDNGSLHTSRLVQQQWPRWQEPRLFIFLLVCKCPSRFLGHLTILIPCQLFGNAHFPQGKVSLLRVYRPKVGSFP